ncbi:MAG: VWA domain-containing protein [Spirochaetales bacterium]|nr:VWA domain-containing protein [Spirochaetales bacterium]
MIGRRHRGLVLLVMTVASLAALAAMTLGGCAGVEPAASPGREASTPSGAEAAAPSEHESLSPSAPDAREEAAKVPELRGGAADGEGGAMGFVAEEEASKASGGLPEASEAAAGGGRAGSPAASGLRAGFADDNRQYNYFLSFLERYAGVPHHPIPVQERIVARVVDSSGKPVPNASVGISSAGGGSLAAGLSYADGSFLFFPGQHGDEQAYRLRVSYNQGVREVSFDRAGRREIEIPLPGPRAVPDRVPLDLLFILDTTGSMGEEIERLKATIEIINLNLSAVSSRPRVRFGMVLYKDRGDQYLTRRVPFTSDIEEFEEALRQVSADGGGDTPEDLQAALREAMDLGWNRDGVRLAFIVTDAPPHLDYGQEYTYVEAVEEARRKGIKIFSVGTGGLDLAGEYVLRQVSQYTAGKYIFLTYGERGESEGGTPGSVSHHTGANYQTDKLEAIIIRIAREELAHLSDQPLEQGEEYFEANRIPAEEAEQTLGRLFAMAVSQLVDYSSARIPPGTAAAVLPVSPAEASLALNAEYFTEQLVVSFARPDAGGDSFRLVERKDLQKILEELELQLSELAESSGDATGAARVGELTGAEVLIVSRLYGKKDNFEMFLKLVRVGTGEVLSVTKAVIDRRLGLEG